MTEARPPDARPSRPWVTGALGLALILAHAAIAVVGTRGGLGWGPAWISSRPAWLLVAAGARTPGSLERAPWRLLSSAFVHVDLGHLASNVVGLAALGAVYEARFGSGRWLAVFVAGAVGGGMMSTWAGVPLSAGASGGIVAWLALAAVVGPTTDRAALRWTLGAVLASSLIFPAVSLSAHAGGALVGVAVGAAMRLAGRAQSSTGGAPRA